MSRKKIGKGRTALITGASGGIGEHLAACFAQGGFDLILVALTSDKLQQVADTLTARHSVKTTVIPADLSLPDSAQNLAATVRSKKLTVDALVNNAGILEQGSFWGIAPERHQQLIALNIAGLTALLDEFVPGMVKRGHGRILNVASVAGFQPVPTLAVYAATKAYVLSLTESLAVELKPRGVTATALCPSFTATNMLNSVQNGKFLNGNFPAALIADPKAVAAEGYEACIRGEAIRVPGAFNRAAMITSRAAPKWLVRQIGGALSRKVTNL